MKNTRPVSRILLAWVFLQVLLSTTLLGSFRSSDSSSSSSLDLPSWAVPTVYAFAPFQPTKYNRFVSRSSETRQDTFDNVNNDEMPREKSHTPRGRKSQSLNRAMNHAGKDNPAHSVTLSPLQVVYDNPFLAATNMETLQQEFQKSAYLRRPVSLRQGLQRMRQALDKYIQQQQQQQHEAWIRLEQRIHSGTTDPLAWLDSQVTQASVRHKEGGVVAQAPLFYFANQEGTTEVAALGSARTVHETSIVWELLNELPDNSRWYGGEPFDPSSPRRGPWEAWNSNQGTAWWVLPAVEIRRDQQDTVLAVHVHPDSLDQIYDLLSNVNERQSEQRAPTTLPPILSRDGSLPQSARDDLQDGQDLYEQAVQAALPRLTQDLDKVVLARPQQLHFGVPLSAGSLLRRWKYGGHEGGHLFWMRPSGRGLGDDNIDDDTLVAPDFVGCTPERLFRIDEQTVSTEALAGTRPRGSTAAADAQLCQDLFDSPKDMAENRLTGEFIVDTLQRMATHGWVELSPGIHASGTASVFVRRLRHLQHICHSYSADIVDRGLVPNVTQYLLEQMHPTPAVCGVPTDKAQQFIREYESIGFDRGFYAGPVGYLGKEQSDLVVAIRSGIIQQQSQYDKSDAKSTLTLYAGAGIVHGSTVQGEWAETNYKLAVVASLFPQSPFSLQGSLTPNTAWAAAFVEELIRNGITQFYICPGSRSTPLVVAVAKALRAHLGIVHADSVHDERAAAFRALGYARAAGKPAAVITSSGTAVANLYPAVVEASMDGVPMLLLTADRPYESRSTGANQAIDQVGIFASTYVRWSRDIPPPSDEVPISLVLSDVDHAVDISKRTRGPVHLNIQFRENLAPDAGKIRNDDRIAAVTKFNAFHFTSTPKFNRWSVSGGQFTKLLSGTTASPAQNSIQEIAELIESSRRGLIVVGNVRPSVSAENSDSLLSVMDSISEFAEHVGFPIFAGVQSAALRFRSSAVVPFAEHLLRSSLIRDNLEPDLIIQIGAPLVSTEIPNLVRKAITNQDEIHHILVHPHSPDERFDPDFSVTHRVSSEVLPWLLAVKEVIRHAPASELAALIPLGRRLGSEMKEIIQRSAAVVSSRSDISLSEPEIVLSLAESIESSERHALFLSNSMPIRDAEAFLYPLSGEKVAEKPVDLSVVGTSRGASGIDGIIATAKGLAEYAECRTTLLIGDVSALHDISSLHALANDARSQKKNPGNHLFPLTTIVVNNDGGGIFSFLPIASHGNEVNFNEFFGTPTSSFNFEQGSEAFGVPYQLASNRDDFVAIFESTVKGKVHSMIEAKVIDRDANVRIHREITSRTNDFLESYLKPSPAPKSPFVKLRARFLPSQNEKTQRVATQRTLLMLHGWMGDALEWNETASLLSERLGNGWSLIALDLQGHGDAPVERSLQTHTIRDALRLDEESLSTGPSVEVLARSVLSSLAASDPIGCIDAIVGYSLGGRVASAMKDLWSSGEFPRLLHNNTKSIVLSSAPRAARPPDAELSKEDSSRLRKDDRLSDEILRTSRFALVRDIPSDDSRLIWYNFVDKWYGAPIWGSLKCQTEYPSLVRRRCLALHKRAPDIAAVLRGCSPARDCPSTKVEVVGTNSLYIFGEEDAKYSAIGKALEETHGVCSRRVSKSGHAILTESPQAVADIIADFLIAGSSPCSTNIVDDDADYLCTTEPLPSLKINPHEELLDKKEDSVFQFVPFSVNLIDHVASSRVQSGIGWGEQASASNALGARSGFLIELRASDGSGIALGEASPLDGVHPETFANISDALGRIQERFESGNFDLSQIDNSRILQLSGYFYEFAQSLADFLGEFKQARSIYTAVEMCLLGLAAQEVGLPVLQALARGQGILSSNMKTSIRLNGLMLRNIPDEAVRRQQSGSIAFSSIKVKVGHQEAKKDLRAVSAAFERANLQLGRGGANIRLDANQAWNETEAMSFAASLEGIDERSFDRIEFIEEPLKKMTGSSFFLHMEDLERVYRRTGLRFALDETLADLACECKYDFGDMSRILRDAFATNRGCAAFVLKPTMLGLELSMQLATLARKELHIGAVFTSCFESGVALAYTAFLAALSDSTESRAPLYAHGLGTFEMLSRDTLSPPFASHVDEFGRLNVAALSRSLYGLSLSELQQAAPSIPTRDTAKLPRKQKSDSSSSFDVSAVQSDSEISFAVSLELPFSSEIAHSRFTDLPQQPRWSPWLSSVAYQGTQETEWNLNVRGISLQWRAQSVILYDPWPAIEWKSVSGLSNFGIAEFIPTGADSCEMKVRLVTRPPRILRPLFRGASIFLEDFIRDKLLKWSLEMFRDVVKADLALERGDVLLGDALYGSVAGKAVAIKEALNSKPTTRRLPPDGPVKD